MYQSPALFSKNNVIFTWLNSCLLLWIREIVEMGSSRSKFFPLRIDLSEKEGESSRVGSSESILITLILL